MAGNLCLTFKAGEAVWAGPVRVEVAHINYSGGKVLLHIQAPGLEVAREQLFLEGRAISEIEAASRHEVLIPRERVKETINEKRVTPTK